MYIYNCECLLPIESLLRDSRTFSHSNCKKLFIQALGWQPTVNPNCWQTVELSHVNIVHEQCQLVL